MSAVRIGLVGCGRLAALGYAPALRRATGVELVAVADPDHRRRAEVLAAHGDLRAGRIAAYPDAAALLAGSEVDAVVLATPAPLHLSDATAATEARVAVLVEKPPAADLPGARALAALDPAPWVGLNRRFDPGARAVRDAIPPTGDIDVHVSIAYRRRSWNAHQAHDDALLDLGPHLVDWVRWLSGAEIVDVTAEVVERDVASLRMRTTRGSATLRARADGIHHERIDMGRPGAGALAVHRVGGLVGAVRGRLRRGPHPLVVSLTAQLEAVGRSLGGVHEPDLGTAADGLAVMAVIDAARASFAADGEPIPVPLTPEP